MGYTAATLAEKYEEAWVTTQEIVQQDVWVLDKQKH